MTNTPQKQSESKESQAFAGDASNTASRREFLGTAATAGATVGVAGHASADGVGRVLPMSHEYFEKLVGEHMLVEGDEGQSQPMKLIEVETGQDGGRPAGMRKPFSLLFQSDQANALPQRRRLISHQEFGSMSVLIVPVGDPKRQGLHEVIFG